MHDRWLKKDETFLDEIKNVNPIKSQYDEYDLFEIPSYCYKTKFPNHKKNKQLILDEMSKMRPGKGCFHNLTKEDFSLPREETRRYSDIFLPNLFHVAEPFVRRTGVNNCSFFYFQYEPNGVDQTFLHNHLTGNALTNTLFSGTYFLDLYDPEDGIVFFDPNEKIGYRPFVEEGDVVFFDPSLPHIGPKTKFAKTVITFNFYVS